MDKEALVAVQAPLKQKYRDDAASAVITLRADARLGEGISCSVSTGRAMAEAGLHPATGGDGTQLCSGDMYSKKEIKSVADVKGEKIRVQATKTEDTHFPAYGAQTVHMPFGEVYTSLQTGVVNIAENGVNVYMANKHYEVAPVLSMTEHEANNNCIWVSDKTWKSLSPQEQQWVQAAADEVARKEPALGLKLESDSAEKLKTMGVKVVDNVDKSGFMANAKPIQDQLAKELGPHAVKILELVRNVK